MLVKRTYVQYVVLSNAGRVMGRFPYADRDKAEALARSIPFGSVEPTKVQKTINTLRSSRI